MIGNPNLHTVADYADAKMLSIPPGQMFYGPSGTKYVDRKSRAIEDLLHGGLEMSLQPRTAGQHRRNLTDMTNAKNQFNYLLSNRGSLNQ